MSDLQPLDLVMEARKTWWEIVDMDGGECRLMGIVRELADEVERLRLHPAGDYVLPCDVRLPPALSIARGCKLSTLMQAFKNREAQTDREALTFHADQA